MTDGKVVISFIAWHQFGTQMPQRGHPPRTTAGLLTLGEAVNLQFLKSCSAEDFAASLAFAIEREWLSNENIMIRLTKSGFDETQKLK